MEDNQFKQVMAMLSSSYGRKLEALEIKVFWQAFKPYTNEQVEIAAMEYISDPELCQFWPKPGSIIGKITGTKNQRELSTADAAMQAWEFITKEIRRIGAYGSLEMDDGVALKAIHSIGGWKDLCHTPIDKMEWRRKEFISAYQTFVGASNLPKSLAGISKVGQDKREAQRALQRLNDGVGKRGIAHKQI